MTLGNKQRLFSELVGKLLIEIGLRGYACTFGAAFRDPAWGVGHRNSLHASRLAIDLNLFKPADDDDDWIYCTQTDEHTQFGVWWERQHELCAWGGRFDDGNHYSIEHGGMK